MKDVAQSLRGEGGVEMTNNLRKSSTEKKDKKKINILTNNADMKNHINNFDLKK